MQLLKEGFMRVHLSSRVILFLQASAFVVALLVIMAIPRDALAAGAFNPYYTLCLANIAPDGTATCDGDNAAGAHTDVSIQFGVGLGPDHVIPSPDDGQEYNFGGVSAFTHPAFFNPTAETDVPVGAVVGHLDAFARLGLLNNGCGNYVGVKFDFYKASINPADSWVEPPTFADIDSWKGWRDDDSDGIVNVIEKYPPMLNKIFPGLQPVGRAVGINTSAVPGTKVLLNFVLFSAGEVLPGAAPDPALGLISVSLLQDFTTSPVPSPVTDFCAPLSTYTTIYGTARDNACTPPVDSNGDGKQDAPCPFEQPLEGPVAGSTPNEGGAFVRNNPPFGGTFAANFLVRSLRDADADGIENFLDPCSFDPTPEFQTRVNADPVWDPDNDGIPGKDDNGDTVLDPDTGCDRTPKQATPGLPANSSLDHDGDWYYNRGDNCPLIPNGVAAQGTVDTSDDVPVPNVTPDKADFNQNDSDADQIGDICDPNPNIADGSRVELLLSVPVTIAGPAPGDADSDTFNDLLELTYGSSPANPLSKPEHSLVSGTCTDTIDNDLDGFSDNADTGCNNTTDTDDDGAPDVMELRAGSDANDATKIPEHPLSYRTSSRNSCSDGLDNDGDGAIDASDNSCTDWVYKGPAPVAAAADGDGDGVPDSADQCVATPATDRPVSAVGCGPGETLKDDDKDGVLNASDVCPNTAAGAKVDATGCAEGQKKVAPSICIGANCPTGGGPSGIGTLAPVGASIPAWAAILAALGAVGVIGGFGIVSSRLIRRRE
jgi:hypothetical protein